MSNEGTHYLERPGRIWARAMMATSRCRRLESVGETSAVVHFWCDTWQKLREKIREQLWLRPQSDDYKSKTTVTGE